MYPHMYRIMKYETGQWIHPHVDHDPYVYGSCTINLNDEYEGGEFQFWGGKHKVNLEKEMRDLVYKITSGYMK